MRFTAYLLAFLSILIVPAKAATLTFVNTTNGGLTFNYTGSVENNQQISSGDYLVIFDFNGLLSGVGPAGWTFGMQTDVAGHPDNASISDAIFTYAGSPIVGVPSGTSLGTFSVTGSFTAQTPGSYFIQSNRSEGPNAGQLIQNIDSTVVAADTNSVPEPGSMILAGGGMLTLSIRTAIRRRRKMQNRA